MRYKIYYDQINKNELKKAGFNTKHIFPKKSFIKKNIDFYKFSYYSLENNQKKVYCIHCNKLHTLAKDIQYLHCKNCNNSSKIISKKARTIHYYRTFIDIVFQRRIWKYCIDNWSDGNINIKLVGIAEDGNSYGRFKMNVFSWNRHEVHNNDMKWRMFNKRTIAFSYFDDYEFYFHTIKKLDKKQRKFILNSDDYESYKDYIKLLNELRIPKNQKWLYNPKFKKLHIYLNKLIESKRSQTLRAKFQEVAKNFINFQNARAIRTYTQLVDEGKRYDNCVSSYASKVVDGRCKIYHFDDGVKHRTVEVVGNEVVQARTDNDVSIIPYLKNKYNTLHIDKLHQ